MTAKPRYDSDGSWKYRSYTHDEWESLKVVVRQKLRPFYPDKNAVADGIFGHPSDVWVNCLLYEAEGAVSTMLWLKQRLTNEELRAERDDLLNTLKKAEEKLSKLSHDFDIMLGVDADVLGCRDKIRELVPRIEATSEIIARRPRANKAADAQHAAAVEMTIRVGRVLSDYGIPVSATGDNRSGKPSLAIQILKIVGDALGLPFETVTWRDKIIEAKKRAPDIK